MAYDEKLVDEVRTKLKGLNAVEKKMFGGIGFMVQGNMCVSVNNRPDHIMMVRIDPGDRESLKRKGAKTAVMRGRAMPGWIFLTKDAIPTADDFTYWIDLAISYNQTLPEKKK